MKKAMNAAELIKKHFIEPIDRRQTFVGVEIELPLVSVQGTPIALAFIGRLAKHIQGLGFSVTRSTLDGDACEWVNEHGDVCSFETTWNTLELSMKQALALREIAARFYPLLISLQAFCLEEGYYLCGKGINPNFANICTAPLRTPILLAKSSYLGQYTKHHDGETFHAICASVQTHLDALNTAQYIVLFNLLRRAYVFDGLFFANSLPPADELMQCHPSLREVNTDTLCFRDELWRHCDAPNVFASAEEIRDADALCQYLMELKLFILPDGDSFYPAQPIRFDTYCEQTGTGEPALRCLRSLAPVAPTQNGSLELRSTCAQPLDQLFAPPAFYLGLAENFPAAKSKVDFIYRRYFPAHTPSQVRDKLMRRSNAPLREQLKQEGIELLEIAVSGLGSRHT